jgi:hypothetical protein
MQVTIGYELYYSIYNIPDLHKELSYSINNSPLAADSPTTLTVTPIGGSLA